MKILTCEQGSAEWFAARAGRATASKFNAILAKGQGKTRATYLRQVCAERITGLPTETFKNVIMEERGHGLEPLARMAYETAVHDLVDQVGLILHDDILVSASPDFLWGKGGGEIKSVLPTTQIETWAAGGYPSEHKPQIMGNIWIAGAEWWDFVSYCPEMPPHLQLYIFRVMPDLEYISALEAEVKTFLADVDAYLAKLPQAPVPCDPNPDEKIHRTADELALIAGFSQHDA